MILCFEIGGSRVRAGLGRPGGVEVLGEMATPGSFAGFVGGLASFLRAGVRGVVLSIAGGVDPVTERSRVANIPCLDGRMLGQEVGAALGVPVLVLNDADCFALAEARWGAGRGYDTVFGIILGTGVGGGLVMGGRVVTGAGGFAGEWGHGPVIAEPALRCGCGLVGCLETVGSARGLERLHLALTGAVSSSEAIVEADGATVARWVDLVSGPLAMVINVVGAGIVPVGGGLGRVPGLIARLDGAVRARVLQRRDVPLVVCAHVSVDAGLHGAAAAGEVAFGG